MIETLDNRAMHFDSSYFVVSNLKQKITVGKLGIEKSEFIILVALLLLSLLVFSALSIDSDEGVVLNSAWLLWHGNSMYVDFANFTSPGAALLALFSWKLYGVPSYFVTKLAFIVFWVFSVFSLLIARSSISLTLKAFVLFALLWVLASAQYPLVNHNTISSVAALLALVALFRFSISPNHWRAVLLGSLCGLVFFFLQTKGLAVLLGVALSLLVMRERVGRLLLLLLSFVITIALFFIQWPMDKVVESLFIAPFNNNYLQVNQSDHLALLSWVLISAVMFLISLKRKEQKLILLSIFQLMLLLSSLNRVDVPHIFINSFPSIIFASLIVSRDELQLGSWAKHMSSVLTIVCMLACLATAYGRFTKVSVYDSDGLQSLDPVFSSVEISNAELIYAGPFVPGLYFHLRKENPFVFAHDMTLCDKQCLARTLAVLRERKPEFALLQYGIVAKYGYSKNNSVDRYLEENYRICPSSSAFEVRALGDCPI